MTNVSRSIDLTTGEILSSGSPFDLAPTALTITGDVTYEEWSEKLTQLRIMEGAVQWWIGDLLNYGEPRYGEKYAQAVDETQAETWRRYANVSNLYQIGNRLPILSWTHHYAVAYDDEPLRSQLLQDAVKYQWSVSELKKAAKAARQALLPAPLIPPGVYQVIYADPPWQYDNTGVHGAAEHHYPTMPLEDICSLLDDQNVQVADSAVLFMWVTNPFLEDACEVVRAWGFEYKTNIVWVKTDLVKPGSGFYVRGRHELLYVATRGSFTPLDEHISPPIGSVVTAPVQEHSRKPDEVYDIIERLYPDTTRIELFSRRSDRPGWTFWGNENG